MENLEERSHLLLMEKSRQDNRLRPDFLASRNTYESMSILKMKRPKFPSLT